jgi:hypothetical protein
VRVGNEGRRANRYVNWRRNLPGVQDFTQFDARMPHQLMPWVWSVIQFDQEGNLTAFAQDSGTGDANLSLFPTVKFWVWGRLGAQDWQSVGLPTNQTPRFPQKSVEALFQLDAVCYKKESCEIWQ